MSKQTLCKIWILSKILIKLSSVFGQRLWVAFYLENFANKYFSKIVVKWSKFITPLIINALQSFCRISAQIWASGREQCNKWSIKLNKVNAIFVWWKDEEDIIIYQNIEPTNSRASIAWLMHVWIIERNRQ